MNIDKQINPSSALENSATSHIEKGLLPFSPPTIEAFEGGDEHYATFPDRECRQDAFRVAQAIAELLKLENVPNVILVDRGARPLYIGLIEYWGAKYAKSQKPNIYFLNPLGFVNQETCSRDEIHKRSIMTYWGGEASEKEISGTKSKKEVIEEFQRAYPNLLKDKDKPLVIFDTRIHTGQTLLPVMQILKELGFVDVRVVTSSKPDPLFNSPVKADYFVSDRELHLVYDLTSDHELDSACYPFGQDKMVKKQEEYIYSIPNKDQKDIAKSVQIRKELHSIMAAGLAWLNKNDQLKSST